MMERTNPGNKLRIFPHSVMRRFHAHAKIEEPIFTMHNLMSGLSCDENEMPLHIISPGGKRRMDEKKMKHV